MTTTPQNSALMVRFALRDVIGKLHLGSTGFGWRNFDRALKELNYKKARWPASWDTGKIVLIKHTYTVGTEILV